MNGLPVPVRPLKWIGSSFKDFRRLPPKVQHQLGYELFLAQSGQHPPSAKPLKGFGAGVVELIEDFDGDTYRAVDTVRLRLAVYVLHAFKKKSKHGLKTPEVDLLLLKQRLKDAEEIDNKTK